jgi:hypothetical protein
MWESAADSHAYTCAADDALGALRRERFLGSADDHGYRTYDPETKSYTRVHAEPDVAACVYPECSYVPGPHGRTWTTGPDGPCNHEYRRPDDATLLTRMRERRLFRATRRNMATGTSTITAWIYHVYGEPDQDPCGVNALYEDLPSAVRTTAYLMELSRLAVPVRLSPNRWCLVNEHAGDVAYIERRPVTRRVRR